MSMNAIVALETQVIIYTSQRERNEMQGRERRTEEREAGEETKSLKMKLYVNAIEKDMLDSQQ